MKYEVISGVEMDDGMDQWRALKPIDYPLPPLFGLKSAQYERDKKYAQLFKDGLIPKWMEIVPTAFGPAARVRRDWKEVCGDNYNKRFVEAGFWN